jgi:hypothetical protein
LHQQYGLLSHFYHEQLSILATVESDAVLQTLSDSQCNDIRALASVKRYALQPMPLRTYYQYVLLPPIECTDQTSRYTGSEIRKAPILLKDNAQLIAATRHWIDNLRTFHKNFAIAFNCYSDVLERTRVPIVDGYLALLNPDADFTTRISGCLESKLFSYVRLICLLGSVLLALLLESCIALTNH